jgi:hypothetical protein
MVEVGCVRVVAPPMRGDESVEVVRVVALAE